MEWNFTRSGRAQASENMLLLRAPDISSSVKFYSDRSNIKYYRGFISFNLLWKEKN